MIRVYFVFEDPFDDTGINLSYVDVPTRDASKAFDRVAEAAGSGELWKTLYPDDEEHPYRLIEKKMAYLDISVLTHELTADTILAL